ncbi:hypothetical protein ACFUEM_08680 [Streptomyces anulatus]|uniref:hypothetical protein n=1 Tax=Streptomyces anulatus TaxID=1892 RepID=UPI0035E308C9
MSRVNITPRFVLDYVVGRYHGQVEVVTKDIGATIGTEILNENGGRICAYRPGTRYPDRAQEVAEEHLRAALELALDGLDDPARIHREVAARLRDVVAGEQKWTPGEEDSW